jgi:hypothetical protein
MTLPFVSLGAGSLLSHRAFSSLRLFHRESPRGNRSRNGSAVDVPQCNVLYSKEKLKQLLMLPRSAEDSR